MMTFSGRSADEVWRQAVSKILCDDFPQTVNSRLGPMRELLHIGFEITDPRQRWVVSRIPAMNPAFTLAEVIWILNGRNDTAFLEHWFPRYGDFVGGSGLQYAAYGQRLRGHFEFDQLLRAHEVLQKNSSSRQIVLNIWSPRDDFPHADGSPRSGDVPCNICSSLKVRDGRLHWMQVVRSNDIDRGFPNNVVQFTMLQEIMAGWLGVGMGEYVHVVDSLHMYIGDSRLTKCEHETSSKENADFFQEPLDRSLLYLNEIANRMDAIIACRRARAPLPMFSRDLPIAYENMYSVIQADDCRRHREYELAEATISTCTNPVYRQLWQRWNRRLHG